ncbi:hypothetical protein KCP76_18690 [Salmonella enterica subsp. enterica serovar Weltevreden]|nr:hypothetical protein KCP76_18690 [Salmonella enterica subsp. enterica serovar Weltevreden]
MNRRLATAGRVVGDVTSTSRQAGIPCGYYVKAFWAVLAATKYSTRKL